MSKFRKARCIDLTAIISSSAICNFTQCGLCNVGIIIPSLTEAPNIVFDLKSKTSLQRLHDGQTTPHRLGCLHKKQKAEVTLQASQIDKAIQSQNKIGRCHINRPWYIAIAIHILMTIVCLVQEAVYKGIITTS